MHCWRDIVSPCEQKNDMTNDLDVVDIWWRWWDCAHIGRTECLAFSPSAICDLPQTLPSFLEHTHANTFCPIASTFLVIRMREKEWAVDFLSSPKSFFSRILPGGKRREARQKFGLNNCRLSCSIRGDNCSLFCLVGMKQCSCYTGRRCEFLVVCVSRLNLERTPEDLVSWRARRSEAGIGTRDWNSEDEEWPSEQQK